MTSLPGIGIFGTGPEVHTIVPLLKSKGFRVEAVWGRSKSDAESTAATLQIPFFTAKIDEVVLRKDVDLVIVFSAPSLQSQICVKALGIGKHVVCDRPAGLNQTETLRMVQAAAYYPTLLAMVLYTLRFLPNIVQLRKLLAEGYIGDVSLVDVRVSCDSLLESSYTWRCHDTMGGGALALLATHIIDLISYLGLGRAVRVHANLRTLRQKTEHIGGIRQVTADDFAVIQLQMSGGVFANIVINSALSGFSQEIVLCGNDGHLVVSGGDLRCRRKGEKEEVLHLDVEDLNAANSSFSPSHLPKIYLRGLVRVAGFLKDKFSEPSSGEPFTEPTFSQGLYVQSVVEALRRSNETRNWTKVETLEEDVVGESLSWNSQSV